MLHLNVTLIHIFGLGEYNKSNTHKANLLTTFHFKTIANCFDDPLLFYYEIIIFVMLQALNLIPSSAAPRHFLAWCFLKVSVWVV